jgi:hypothetical protein
VRRAIWRRVVGFGLDFQVTLTASVTYYEHACQAFFDKTPMYYNTLSMGCGFIATLAVSFTISALAETFADFDSDTGCNDLN